MIEHSATDEGAITYDLTKLAPTARLRLLGQVSFSVDERSEAIFVNLLERTAALIQLRIDLDDGDRPTLHVWRAAGLDESARLRVDLLTAEVIEDSSDSA